MDKRTRACPWLILTLTRVTPWRAIQRALNNSSDLRGSPMVCTLENAARAPRARACVFCSVRNIFMFLKKKFEKHMWNEPPLQNLGRMWWKTVPTRDLYGVSILLLCTKTPEIVKKQIPPLQDSARSNSKYIGEKPSVMLWYTANPQTGTHPATASNRALF